MSRRPDRKPGRHARTVPVVALVFAAFLTACSESISVLVHHGCADPLSITLVDGQFRQPPKLVDPGVDTVVHSICCEPGQDGEVMVATDRWETNVSYDQLRKDPVVAIPPEACVDR